MSDMQKWMEEVLEPNKTLFLCFFLYVCMYIMRGPESSSYNFGIEFVDILFQISVSFDIFHLQ